MHTGQQVFIDFQPFICLLKQPLLTHHAADADQLGADTLGSEVEVLTPKQVGDSFVGSFSGRLFLCSGLLVLLPHQIINI